MTVGLWPGEVESGTGGISSCCYGAEADKDSDWVGGVVWLVG